MVEDEKEYLGKYISKIYKDAHYIIGHKLGQKGVNQSQIMILKQLYNKEGINQEELSKQLFVDKATAARSIKKLEEQGFVTRKRDINDKRSYRVYLTSKSMEVKQEINASIEAWQNEILKNISKEEQEIFISVLKRISQMTE